MFLVTLMLTEIRHYCLSALIHLIKLFSNSHIVGSTFLAPMLLFVPKCLVLLLLAAAHVVLVSGKHTQQAALSTHSVFQAALTHFHAFKMWRWVAVCRCTSLCSQKSWKVFKMPDVCGRVTCMWPAEFFVLGGPCHCQCLLSGQSCSFSFSFTLSSPLFSSFV